MPRKLESEFLGPDWQELWLLMRREYEVWFNIYMIRPDGGEAIRIIAKDNHIYGFDVPPEGNRILHRYPNREKSRTP